MWVCVSGSSNFSTAEVLVNWCLTSYLKFESISELDVSLEESNEGLKFGTSVWGWVLIWLNTDLASSVHILSPVSPQEKRDSQGCATAWLCLLLQQMLQGCNMGEVVGKAKQWKKAEPLDLAHPIEGIESLTWESRSSFSPGWM